jgi:hypothetical protein
MDREAGDDGVEFAEFGQRGRKIMLDDRRLRVAAIHVA